MRRGTRCQTTLVWRVWAGNLAKYSIVNFMSVENLIQSKCIAHVQLWLLNEIWDSYAARVHGTGFFKGHEIINGKINFLPLGYFAIPNIPSLQCAK